MTNQNVVVPPDAVVPPAAAAAAPGTGGSPALRPCGASAFRGELKRKLLKQLEISSAARCPRSAAATAAGAMDVSSWVEAMKASSPTAAAARGHGAAMDSWVARHPSALGAFEEIARESRGKRVAVFLDYDGTLSPIVDDPDRAFMSDAMRTAVRDVARCFPTAIVSGRSIDKVYSFVQLAELYYAGSHGMDIKGPAAGPRRDGDAQAHQLLFQPASKFVPMIQDLYHALKDKTRAVPGALVETNKFCLSVHFRCVDEKRWGALEEIVRATLPLYPGLRLTRGRKVLEVRPCIEWDKGKALGFLLSALGMADDPAVLPIYIGDDRTDEDAFRVLNQRGGAGVGILVSKVPRETDAAYSLRDPAEVMDFLNRLVDHNRKQQQRQHHQHKAYC